MPIYKMDRLIGDKLDKLKISLVKLESVAVAYSGGVDSTLLLKLAFDELGSKTVGVYCDSALQPSRERKAAIEIAQQIGVKLITLEGVDLQNDAFRLNPDNRCYLCKSLIFDRIIATAKENGFQHIVDGSNTDDLKDYRPGKKALNERGVISPLQEAGLTKEEIRIISKDYQLPTWDKDALACLATRIPYNEEVNIHKLKLIDKIEELLVFNGYRNVRARLMKDTIKLEVRSDQVSKLKNSINKIGVKDLLPLKLGLKIEIDQKGYRQGSMNNILS